MKVYYIIVCVCIYIYIEGILVEYPYKTQALNVRARYVLEGLKVLRFGCTGFRATGFRV